MLPSDLRPKRSSSFADERIYTDPFYGVGIQKSQCVRSFHDIQTYVGVRAVLNVLLR
jgi:hypothetical protein